MKIVIKSPQKKNKVKPLVRRFTPSSNSLLHLPIEAYRMRYTEFLHEWEKSRFSEKFRVTQVRGDDDRKVAVLDIRKGSVLDTHQRPIWCLNQMRQLLEVGYPNLGKIYCSDFYTPGLDALKYSGTKFEISSFLWAQTFDRYDFTTKMIDWMRPWEIMAFEIYSKVFVASSILAELIVTALPHVEQKIQIVGLPFDSIHVLRQLKAKEVPPERFNCVYTSRWDSEKNPEFFLDMVVSNPDISFAICTGWDDLYGNDYKAIARAKELAERKKNLTIFKGLEKGRYYAILSQCDVQFNCAYQDWVSFTLLEALALGCAPLYPNFRSFPEALHYYSPSLYDRESVADASEKLRYLLDNKFPDTLRKEILDYHDGTLSRIAMQL